MRGVLVLLLERFDILPHLPEAFLRPLHDLRIVFFERKFQRGGTSLDEHRRTNRIKQGKAFELQRVEARRQWRSLPFENQSSCRNRCYTSPRDEPKWVSHIWRLTAFPCLLTDRTLFR